MAITWLAAEWAAKWRAPQVVFAGLMTVVLTVLMVCASKQTAYWRNTETLWAHTVDCTTNNAMGHYSLGDALSQKGSEDEAITQYQMALQIVPDFVEVHDNLGVALMQMGRVDEAITQFKMALQIKPDNPKARNNLGFALIRRGRADEAIPCFQLALETKPDYVQARINLANAFLQKGNIGEAMAHFQKALQIEPANPVLQNNLAWLMATCLDASLRNGNKAVELAQQANALTGGTNRMILRTLAAAYAEAGQFSNATESAQKAMTLARAAGQQDLAAQLNEEFKHYEAQLPWHQ
jgi:Flp pilus assembly protein TadD